MSHATLFLDFWQWDLVLASGTSSWSTRDVEFGLGGPTLVGDMP